VTASLSHENITVSMDDDVYRAARIKAAEQDTSISDLFKAFLSLRRCGDRSIDGW